MPGRNRKKPRPKEVTRCTRSISEAFRLALSIGGTANLTRHGKSVVRDVEQGMLGVWVITYRPVRRWGKEAWE